MMTSLELHLLASDAPRGMVVICPGGGYTGRAPHEGAPIAAKSPAEQPLSEREVQVLQLVAQGLSNKEIADRIVVSERTVRAHVSNILNKLHLANRTQAALYAIREGLSDAT